MNSRTIGFLKLGLFVFFAASVSVSAQSNEQCREAVGKRVKECASVMNKAREQSSASAYQAAGSASGGSRSAGVSLMQQSSFNVEIWTHVKATCENIQDRCESACSAGSAYGQQTIKWCKQQIQQYIGQADDSIAYYRQVSSDSLQSAMGSSDAAGQEELTPTQQALQNGAESNPYSGANGGSDEEQVAASTFLDIRTGDMITIHSNGAQTVCPRGDCMNGVTTLPK